MTIICCMQFHMLGELNSRSKSILSWGRNVIRGPDSWEHGRYQGSCGCRFRRPGCSLALPGPEPTAPHHSLLSSCKGFSHPLANGSLRHSHELESYTSSFLVNMEDVCLKRRGSSRQYRNCRLYSHISVITAHFISYLSPHFPWHTPCPFFTAGA